MSIVEKAANLSGGTVRRRSMKRVRERHGLGPSNGSQTETFQTVKLDSELIAEQGFYTPTAKRKRLALELRAIKRRLLRRLDFSRHGTISHKAGERQKNVVLLTSTRPAEGKTFTAINLALSLAIEDGIPVLLIDADVPRPKVFAQLGLDAGIGLTDRVLDPSLDISDLIVKAEGLDLSLMSQGKSSEAPNEIFSRREMKELVRELSLRFPDHLIIFDAPPVLATPEAVTIAKHVDEVIFVVEASATPEPAVAAALEEVLDVQPRISLILNRCLVPERASEYGSYEEYYYKDFAKGEHGQNSAPQNAPERKEPNLSGEDA